MIEEAHPGLVSKELFERANGIRTWNFAGSGKATVQSPYLLSGLIRCSTCGFSYNGYSRREKKLRYYADSGVLAKGRSVCSWHTIPQLPLERFVLNSIAEIIIDSRIELNLENLIRDCLESRGQGGDGPLRHVEASMRECEGKLRNLLSLVEAGVALETVLPRIKEIERERDRLA